MNSKNSLIIVGVVAILAGFVGGMLSTTLLGTVATSVPSILAPRGDIKVVDEESATIDVVKRVSPAVVSIVISKDLGTLERMQGNSFMVPPGFQFGFPFDFSFGFPQQQPVPKSTPKNQKPQKQEIGGGSGFIITADGLILTNKHVVEDTEADYTVITNDGKRHEAKVVARDPVSDLAFVRITAKDLPVVILGDSEKLQIGQTVIAIGNALGEYRNTVTKGVISGTSRKVEAGNGRGQSEVLEEALQTDAAINWGNSGGPLLNLKGEVVGINTAVNLSGQLIGFAIPINAAKSTLETVKKDGKIVRPYLGVRYILLNPTIAEKNNLKIEQGALVLRGEDQQSLAVIPGSPADKAGIVENDIILEVNGVKVSEEKPLAKEIAKHKVGEELTLKVSSKGKEKTVKVMLEEFPTK